MPIPAHSGTRCFLAIPTDSWEAAERAWTLDQRVLVRGCWRRHRHYKTPDGQWAEKQTYIGLYLKGQKAHRWWLP